MHFLSTRSQSATTLKEVKNKVKEIEKIKIKTYSIKTIRQG